MITVFDIIKQNNLTNFQTTNNYKFKQAYKRPSKQAMSERLYRIGAAYGKESGGIFDEIRQELLSHINGIQILESGRISLSSITDEQIESIAEIIPTMTELNADARESLENAGKATNIEDVRKEVNAMYGELHRTVRVILQHWYEFQQDNPALRNQKFQDINEKLKNAGKVYSFREIANIVNDEIKPMLAEYGVDLSDVNLIAKDRDMFKRFMKETYRSHGGKQLVWTGSNSTRPRLTQVYKVETDWDF